MLIYIRLFANALKIVFYLLISEILVQVCVRSEKEHAKKRNVFQFERIELHSC